MKNILLLLLSVFSASIAVNAQTGSSAKPATTTPTTPKLIVGIVIDQMRYDYLSKYYNKFGEGGFKKLLNQGFNCKNTSYNYMPTYTGPGHASIYTGTTPAQHGIIANDWFVRSTNAVMYVTDDDTAKTVGSKNPKVGKMSPRNMLASTFGDELKLYNNGKSKVIGVALKDRSSILPAGHLSNGSYWFDSYSGNFVTSTFYKTELPKWVSNFNAQQLAKKYLSQPWNTLLPINQYTESAADDNPYEGFFKGETKPVFPHNLPAMYTDSSFEVLRYCPSGNTITKDMALTALKGENLGKGAYTDVLAISFSTPDYVGHKFGPQSIELEDTYIRLDKELAELITYLETNYGKDNFLLFLTADHAASYVAEQMMDLKMPAGYFNSTGFVDSLKKLLQKNYGDTAIYSEFINEQIYLNRSLLAAKKLSLEKIQTEVAEFAIGFEGVANAYTAPQLNGEPLKNQSAGLIQNGFYRKRSGDVALLLEPAWMDWSHTGTTHGTPYSYDTRVPLLWYGWKVKTGEYGEPVNITDIAPTISSLLKIMPPNGCTGKPISPIIK